MANNHHATSKPSPIQERARTKALFTSIGDGIIATDENGKVTEVNSAAIRIFGYHAEELLGKWFPHVVRAFKEDGTEVARMDRPVMQAMLTGKPISDKAFFLAKSGRLIPCSVTVSPIMIDDHPVGAIEVFRDITHEHEVDRMKSEFISIASHQLRTPLTAIKTYSHMLAEGYGGALNDHQKDFMEIILGSIARMNELINTLLDISRIEEGRLSVAPQTTDLKDILQEIITELQPLAAARSLQLKSTFKAKKSKTTTDPLLVKEVCANLLSNAIKYTPERGTVHITLDQNGKDFIFVITDTGYGIPYDEQKRVFTKFFRAENILDKDTSGTGLGLYLVKQVVQNLGGKISFTSTEDKGSTFTFTIPISK
jgi:PAS domain S-box-containing protein